MLPYRKGLIISKKKHGSEVSAASLPSSTSILVPFYVHLEDGPGKGEQYHVTHPIAMVNGMLRGSFYVTVGESTVITCEGLNGTEKGKERLRAVIEYKEEVCVTSK